LLHSVTHCFVRRLSSASDLSDQIFGNVIVCVCFVAEAARTSKAKSQKHRMLIEHDVKKWLNSLWSSLRWSSSPVAVRLFYSVHLPGYTNGIKQSQRLLFSALYIVLYLLFSDNSRCMSIRPTYRLMSV